MTMRRTTSTPNEMTEKAPFVTAYPRAAAPLRRGQYPSAPEINAHATPTHTKTPFWASPCRSKPAAKSKTTAATGSKWQYDEADEDASQRSHYRTIARASGTRHPRA